ncbi:MAG TPA: OsmC family peroxiredoxin [Fimbriimonadaceae bacterium]|nr:OsmC family peroxiredoxin [Fimbriimonadaceae bacterium]
MDRSATAVWKGGLKDGNGNVSTQSGALQSVPYTFRMRFEEEPGTTPEELIAAAHSSCFSMALSGQLEERGIHPTSIETKATVTMQNLSVTKSHLALTVHAQGADRAKAEEAWNAAKSGCPISKLLNCEITLDANLKA